MRLTLEVRSQLGDVRTITVEPGAVVRVGRKLPSQIIVEGDLTLSRAHFSLSYDGEGFRLVDLGSTSGTLINDIPVSEALLNDGDVIEAGSTLFVVRLEGAPARDLTTAVMTPRAAKSIGEQNPSMTLVRSERSVHDRLLDCLRSERGALFAVLDAARDPLILALLHECEEEHKSLYEGLEGEKLMAFAPYLVSLPPKSEFLEKLVRQGWGKSWGIYVTCDRPFAEVRKHFRHFLLVELDGRRKVYFRFYDPRVLRVYLPTCNPEELTTFFGPSRCFLTEPTPPEKVLRFAFEGSRLQTKTIPLNIDLEVPTMLPVRLSGGTG